MSALRFITVNDDGQIVDVVHMFDRRQQRISDPTQAQACVLHLAGHYWEVDADLVPIYTVH